MVCEIAEIRDLHPGGVDGLPGTTITTITTTTTTTTTTTITTTIAIIVITITILTITITITVTVTITVVGCPPAGVEGSEGRAERTERRARRARRADGERRVSGETLGESLGRFSGEILWGESLGRLSGVSGGAATASPPGELLTGPGRGWKTTCVEHGTK